MVTYARVHHVPDRTILPVVLGPGRRPTLAYRQVQFTLAPRAYLAKADIHAPVLEIAPSLIRVLASFQWLVKF
jgi:hypothetical protein